MRWDESSGRVGRQGAGAGSCHTGNWRCEYRSAADRVGRYQNRTRDVHMRIKATWARLGAETRGGDGQSCQFCQFYGQSYGEIQSVVGGGERANREYERHTDVCYICARRGWHTAAEGSGEARRARAGRKGSKRRRKEVSLGSPLCSNTPTKQRSLRKAHRACGNSGLVDFPSLIGDHNHTSTSRTLLCAHQGYRKG